MRRVPGHLAALRQGVGVVAAIVAVAFLTAGHTVAGTPYGAATGSSALAASDTGSDASGWKSDWDRRWWIDKTARLLRGGDGLGPDDDIDALLGSPKEQIVRRFMRDPRFGDSILDFNLFFLGFKSDVLKVEGSYDRAVFDFPNAVGAAQAVLSGGDYFKLFDFEGPFFMAPLRTEPLDDPPDPDDAGLTQAELRAKAIGELQEAVSELLEEARGADTADTRALCRKVIALTKRTDELSNRLFRAFDDAEVFALIRGEVVTAPMAELTNLARRACTARAGSRAVVRLLIQGLEHTAARFQRAFAEMAKFEPAVYHPATVREFKPFDLSAFPTRQKWLSFGFEQGIALANSSTNFNRKRSAYVLKRFFCDDLIPIGFEEPMEHVGGAHGSKTSCFACHYKLDPMAGFFRSRGAYFFDYSHSEDIIFDDLASKDRKLYEAVWRAAGKARPGWNVGYIRSSRWRAQNSYGSTISDLSRIVRSAPEVKRCLIRRLFEYVVAEDQTVDGGYLDHLARQFETEAAENSSAAMKNAIVRILQSATYGKRDIDPRQCYDFALGRGTGDGPPCRVAFILDKNCGQCHYESDEDAGRLDVGSWIVAPDGLNRTFRHLDSHLLQLSAQDSLARIIERLSAHDQKVRMPKGRSMPGQERQELFMWAQQELARVSRHGAP